MADASDSSLLVMSKGSVTPWSTRQLTIRGSFSPFEAHHSERELAASGPLLAAYDKVNALEHCVEWQLTMLAGAAAKLKELRELRTYATSCEDRAELRAVLEDAERDWDELDSRHQEQSAVVQSQSRRISDLERTLLSTKALTVAYNEREKETQSLREQWEALASAALVRDAALAKAAPTWRKGSLPSQPIARRS